MEETETVVVNFSGSGDIEMEVALVLLCGVRPGSGLVGDITHKLSEAF